MSDAWLPADLGKKITATALRKSALHDLLTRQGVKLGNITQEVTAVLADPVNARILQSEVGAPLLRMTRIIYSSEGRPIQHLISYVSPEKSRFIMHFPGGKGDPLMAGRFVHDILGRGRQGTGQAMPSPRKRANPVSAKA